MKYQEVDALDWKTVRPHVDELLARELTPETIDAWLQDWSDLTAVIREAGLWIHRAVTENTADEDAEKRFLTYVEQILPQSKLADQALRDKLLALPWYKPGRDNLSLFRRFQTDAELFRAENVPIESELMKLGNRYDKIAGAMSIEWDGTAETMAQAEVHLLSSDRGERERAWRLIMERWLRERTALNDLYLEMLPHRRALARNAGLRDYREYAWRAMARFDYSPADCFTFHDAIEHEVVPLARELYAERARLLGVSSVRPWDVNADLHGEHAPVFGDARELDEGVLRIFNRVDPELARHYEAMRDGFLDLPARPNKAPGAYCEGFPVSRMPYIFMSAAGTRNDVRTLLHEGGHAFHYMESLRHPLVWNNEAPVEFCEVASMGMELLAAPYLERSEGGFFDAANARRSYREQLEGIVRFLPYMAVVDAFQHWVYADAPERVTSADLDAKWSELWERFMQGADWSGLEREKVTGWHRKLHIFTYPFYYIEYGLAQVGALQVWRNALRDQAGAVRAYREALALGYTRSLPELFQAAGGRFAFDRATIGELMQLVRSQLERLGEAA